MAWASQAFQGSNSVEPADTNKQGPGLAISNTGIETSLANKKKYPGALSLKDMSGIQFDGAFEAGTSWNTDNISKWFRDDGNTTTQEQ